MVLTLPRHHPGANSALWGVLGALAGHWLALAMHPGARARALCACMGVHGRACAGMRGGVRVRGCAGVRACGCVRACVRVHTYMTPSPPQKN